MPGEQQVHELELGEELLDTIGELIAEAEVEIRRRIGDDVAAIAARLADFLPRSALAPELAELRQGITQTEERQAADRRDLFVTIERAVTDRVDLRLREHRVELEERLLELAKRFHGDPGEPGPPGRDGDNGQDASLPEHTGPYEAGRRYRSGQETLRNGSTFRALRDTADPPGDSHPDWIMIAAKGRRGDPGPPGPVGPPGKPGSAPTVVVLQLAGGVLELADGTIVEIVYSDGLVERLARPA